MLTGWCSRPATQRLGIRPELRGFQAARAFFYAGARALLVSHWSIEDEATVRITTGVFGRLSKDPSLSRAEALRLAMLDLIDNSANPENAFPAFWAPFVVVGQ